MNTCTKNNYLVLQVVFLAAIVIILFVGITFYPNPVVWVIFFCGAAWAHGWLFRQWFPASANSFIVSKGDGVVLCSIMGPCMVWMRGDMRGRRVINYKHQSHEASLEVVTAAESREGGVIITTLKVGAVVATRGDGLQNYYDRFKKPGMTETENQCLGSCLCRFVQSHHDVFCRDSQRTWLPGTREWERFVLGPALNSFCEQALAEVGMRLAYTPYGTSYGAKSFFQRKEV